MAVVLCCSGWLSLTVGMATLAPPAHAADVPGTTPEPPSEITVTAPRGTANGGIEPLFGPPALAARICIFSGATEGDPRMASDRPVGNRGGKVTGGYLMLGR